MRTTRELVGAIIELDAAIDLTPFIAVAEELVSECCAPLGYTSQRLEMIESWLTAHLYTVRDPLPASEGAGRGINSTYQGKTAMHFDASIYGQHALLLDTLGGLATLQARIALGLVAAPSLHWLGTNDPVPYNYRFPIPPN